MVMSKEEKKNQRAVKRRNWEKYEENRRERERGIGNVVF